MIKACFILALNQQSHRKYIITQYYELIHKLSWFNVKRHLVDKRRAVKTMLFVLVIGIVTISYTCVMPYQMNINTIIQCFNRIGLYITTCECGSF